MFDHVFVPNERIFVNGETEFAGMLVERFAGYHRQSYGGCKVGVGDVLIGAAAVAADYNGANKASHIKDKLIEMTHLNEDPVLLRHRLLRRGRPTESGNYMIDLLLANVCKQNVTRFPYEIVRLAEDIAGGLMVTAPGEADLRREAGARHRQVPQGVSTVSTENRLRICASLRTCPWAPPPSATAPSPCTAPAPQAQRIMISRQGNLAHKKELAKGHRPHQGVSKTIFESHLYSTGGRRKSAALRLSKREASAMWAKGPSRPCWMKHVRPLPAHPRR